MERKSKFFSYTELTKTSKRIYLDTEADSLPRTNKESANGLKDEFGKFCIFHKLDGHETDECRHLRDLIEERVQNNRLPQYVKKQVTIAQPKVVQQERPPSAADVFGCDRGCGSIMTIQ